MASARRGRGDLTAEQRLLRALTRAAGEGAPLEGYSIVYDGRLWAVRTVGGHVSEIVTRPATEPEAIEARRCVALMDDCPE